MKVLGIFDRKDAHHDAVERVRKEGYADLVQYSPIHLLAGEDIYDTRRSPVRWYTLAGGLFGVTSGFAFCIWTMIDQGLIVGGKPIVSLPAFTIIAFEMTILFGALFTFAGFLIHARVPRRNLDEAYDPVFTGDKYGIAVECRPEEAEKVSSLLRSAGALEVRVPPPVPGGAR